MKKLIKNITPNNFLQLEEKLKSAFQNFTHYYGNEEKIYLVFSDNSNEAEVDTFLDTLTNGFLNLIRDKEEQVSIAYNNMVEDVYNEMENVFGTRNDVSASAFAATYEAMLKRPENYIDETLGLSDSASVTAYATSKISASDAYGVFRMKRIAQYQAEKTAIENG